MPNRNEIHERLCKALKDETSPDWIQEWIEMGEDFFLMDALEYADQALRFVETYWRLSACRHFFRNHGTPDLLRFAGECLAAGELNLCNEAVHLAYGT